MRTEGSVEIQRPINEVFEMTIYDVTNWSQVVIRDEVIEEKPGMVGTTFKTVTLNGGSGSKQTMEFEGVVTHHQPPHLHAIQMSGKAFDIEAVYKFEDLGDRTRVTQLSDVTGKGIFKYILKFLGGFMKKASCEALDRELDSLRRFCESKKPTEPV